jgi:hypothetical protein
MIGADDDMVQLRAQVQELTDRQDLCDLVNRLGMTLDEQRMEDLGDVYTEDVVFGETAEQRGLDALIRSGRDAHGVFEVTQHIITNVLIELDGDRASIRANLIAAAVPRAEEPSVHFDLGGVYRFDAVRTAVGWRLCGFSVEPVWTLGDDPRVEEETG